MLYGAYGTTGRLVLEHALRRGHRPLLAGRDPVRLSALASETGLEMAAFRLDSRESIRRALAGVSALVNAAGPYSETGGPLRAQCLEAAASYVDLNGEIDDFLQALSCDTEARARGIAIIPGAGFGVVFGEALAAHVTRRLPDASWLRISLAAANASHSHGAERSTALVLVGGGYAVSGGKLLKRPVAFTTWRVAAEINEASRLRFAAAPRAELVAAQRLTGVKEIVAGVPLSCLQRWSCVLPGRLLARCYCARQLGALLRSRPPKPQPRTCDRAFGQRPATAPATECYPYSRPARATSLRRRPR